MAKHPKASTGPVKIGEVWRVNGSQTLIGVHTLEDCSGACPLHSPSEHSMVDFPLYWREDRAYFERMCPHGVGHPDPDNMDYLFSKGVSSSFAIHGCDGCCMEEE